MACCRLVVDMSCHNSAYMLMYELFGICMFYDINVQTMYG